MATLTDPVHEWDNLGGSSAIGGFVYRGSAIKELQGKYLFADAFFWEDVVSMGVIALHTAYLAGLALEWAPRTLMVLALVAYGTYAVNAIQFVLKLRAARLQEAESLRQVVVA